MLNLLGLIVSFAMWALVFGALTHYDSTLMNLTASIGSLVFAQIIHHVCKTGVNVFFEMGTILAHPFKPESWDLSS